jgi:hypothetical protein
VWGLGRLSHWRQQVVKVKSMKCFFMALLFLSEFCISAQSILQIRPDVITECPVSGLGHATIVWNYPGLGPVQVRVGPASQPMTGFPGPVGTADTGDWVSDGLLFTLVDSVGQELARVTARVKCSPFPDPIGAALAASSYFPLQVGNEWVYRIDSRVGTANYSTMRVAGVRLIGDQAWYSVITGENPQTGLETLYRADAQGRIYQLDGNGREILWLDPTPNPNPSASLQILNGRGQPFRNALGFFPDTISYVINQSLSRETGLLARGVGRIDSRADSLTGSSGGFVDGLDLVYARIGGNIRFATPVLSVGLSVESNDLDVSGGNVTNCAVPCYFVACGLAPGADPPGTYRPCFQTRVRLENLPVQDSTTLDLDLIDAGDRSVYHTSATVAAGQAQPDSILVRQLQLYSAPNQPFPPGAYRVQVKAKITAGDDIATATIPVRVR